MKLQNKNKQLNQRELLLLLVLLTLTVAFIGYKVNKPLWLELQTLVEDYELATVRYNGFNNQLDHMDNLETTLVSLNDELQGKEERFPKAIEQSNVIRKLNHYSKKNHLDVMNMAFGQVQEKDLSTFIVSTDTGGEEPPNVGNLQVSTYDVTLSFGGNEKDIYDFLGSLEEDEHFITLHDFNMVALDEGISGSIRCTFYGIDLSNESPIVLPPTPVTTDSYSGILASSAKNSKTVKKERYNMYNPDFALIINTYLENGPKVFLSEPSNSQQLLSSNEEGQNKASLLVYEEDSLYKYSLSLNNENFEGTLKGDGENQELLLNVYSKFRKSAMDYVNVELQVENKTTKNLNILVISDDPQQPRLQIVEQVGKVLVKDV